MHYDYVRAAKPYNPELLAGPDIVIEPELPGRVIAKLALRAAPELSGKYFHWDAADIRITTRAIIRFVCRSRGLVKHCRSCGRHARLSAN